MKCKIDRSGMRTQIIKAWVMAAKCRARHDKLYISQVSKTAIQKWHGKTIADSFQEDLDILEDMLDSLIINMAKAFKVFIAGPKPR